MLYLVMNKFINVFSCSLVGVGVPLLLLNYSNLKESNFIFSLKVALAFICVGIVLFVIGYIREACKGDADQHLFEDRFRSTEYHKEIAKEYASKGENKMNGIIIINSNAQIEMILKFECENAR